MPTARSCTWVGHVGGDGDHWEDADHWLKVPDEGGIPGQDAGYTDSIYLLGASAIVKCAILAASIVNPCQVAYLENDVAYITKFPLASTCCIQLSAALANLRGNCRPEDLWGGVFHLWNTARCEPFWGGQTNDLHLHDTSGHVDMFFFDAVGVIYVYGQNDVGVGSMTTPHIYLMNSAAQINIVVPGPFTGAYGNIGSGVVPAVGDVRRGTMFDGSTKEGTLPIRRKVG